MGNRVNVYLKADNIISSLGFGTEETLDAIRRYQTGITLRTGNRISNMPTRAATLNKERLAREVELHGLKQYTRIEQLFILSIKDVLTRSGIHLTDPDCGLILASTKGNIDKLQQAPACSPEDVSLWKMAERVAAYFGRSGDVHVLSNACISGVSAAIVAKRWIEDGRYKQVVVAGADVLSPFITSGFVSFKSVSRRICRPYDAARDGLNLGEGCGTILLSAQGAPGDVILAGGSISNDANHISGPSRTGDGLALAINRALEEANLTAADIDFVNAHGTATAYNDEMEAKAIHLAGLQQATVNSLKSYIGHTLGAAGIIETIVSAHGLKQGIVFGTYRFEDLGVSVPLKVSAQHSENLPLKAGVKTASGFGGCNAAIVLALSGRKEATGAANNPAVKTVRTVVVENSNVKVDGETVLESSESTFAGFIRQAYKDVDGGNMKFYKMSDFCQLGYVASCYLMKGYTYAPHQAAIVMANANASLKTDIHHQHIIQSGGTAAASPAVFVYTLPNVLTGEICIRHKIQGENTFFIGQSADFDELEAYAKTVMKRTALTHCIVGWCDLMGEAYRAELRLLMNTESL